MGSEQSSVNPDPKGKIAVELDAAYDSCQTLVKASGYRTHAITDEERQLFRITPYKLKKAVKEYHGKIPTDAFVSSPTLYGDLYARYDNFYPILTTVTPVRAEIIDAYSTVTTLATRRFINNSNETGNFSTTFSETVSNTVDSKWSNELECGLNVSYDIGLPESPKISLRNKFGTEFNKSRTVTISSENSVSATLGPGKSVVAHLKSRKNIVHVEVTYKLTLAGDVACNYEGSYKGHTFWAFDINDVLEAADKPTVLETSEILELNYYTDGEIEMTNLNRNCSATDDYCFRHGVRDYYLRNS